MNSLITRRLITLGFGLFFCLFLEIGMRAQTKNITFDGRSFMINGERILIRAADVQYCHSPFEKWEYIIKQCKKLGINTIQTYTFWNLHEREHGNMDFSGRLDLVRFIELCQQEGMYVILRMGPYVCAETNYGGFPAWLRDIPGMKTRTFNEPFIKETERWLHFLTNKIHPYLASKGGPIIICEIENEYDAEAFGDFENKYSNWYINLAKELDLQVPLMCTQEIEGGFNSIHSSECIDLYRWREENADIPPFWSEAWPGWYNTFGSPYWMRKPEQMAYWISKFYAIGGTGVTLYPYYGGTFFAREGMYLQTPRYWASPPLDEYGDATTMGKHLGAMFNKLKEYEDILLNNNVPQPQIHGGRCFSIDYGNGNKKLTFIVNDGIVTEKILKGNKEYEVAPFSTIIVYRDSVQFNSAIVASEDEVNREFITSTTVLENWQGFTEPLPADRAENNKTYISKLPIEQLRLTKDKTDYCWYSTDIDFSDKPRYCGSYAYLTLTRAADLVHIFVDGNYQNSTTLPLIEDRGPINSPAYTQQIPIHIPNKSAHIDILAVSLGMIKHNSMVGYEDMVNEKKGLWGPVYWIGWEHLGEWTMSPFLSAEDTGSFKSELRKNLQWEDTIHTNQPLSWFKASFSKPDCKGGLAIDMGSMNKGMIWLNQKCLCRYWLIPATGKSVHSPANTTQAQKVGEPTQRYYYIPESWLKEKNEIIIFEEYGGAPQKIKLTHFVDKFANKF